MAEDAPRGLQVAVWKDGDATVIAATGEADVTGTPPLREALAHAVEREEGDVVVDLGGVTFLDSTGLATLLNVVRRLRRTGRALVVAAATPPVLRVIRMAHLEDDLRCAPTVEAGLARRRS